MFNSLMIGKCRLTFRVNFFLFRMGCISPSLVRSSGAKCISIKHKPGKLLLLIGRLS